MRRIVLFAVLLCGLQAVAVGKVAFTAAPAVKRTGKQVTISFEMAAPCDVEVSILDDKGKVVRHLAAGALDGEKAPPAPLKPGLKQAVAWDGTDDFRKPATGKPFSARVRAGGGVTFDRFIGTDPYNFGGIQNITCDDTGNVYVLGTYGGANQGHMTLRVFDPDGRYLREIMPFPADLPADAMKDVARWDAERKTFRPRNLKSLNPDFYGCPGKWGGHLTLVAAGKRHGAVLTNGGSLFTLEITGAVRGEKLVSRKLWGKKPMKNSGRGPTRMAFSPDGQFLYLAGPYASKTRYGHKFIPDFPPGRVYRLALDGAGHMEEFVTIEVAHVEGQKGQWWKNCVRKPGSGGIVGALHGVTVDSKGRVYVCDREHSCIVVFDESGKKFAAVPVQWPTQVAVHPRTGAIYVLTNHCVAYHKYEKLLLKFAGLDAKEPIAEHDLGLSGRGPYLALSAGKNKTVAWIGGVTGGVVAIEDKGNTLEPMATDFKPRADVPRDWNRITVDYSRDELYVSNGTTGYWRYNGVTGEGGRLMLNGKPFYVNDLEVGYDGLLYLRVSNKQIGKSSIYSGPLWRMTRDLEPAPYEGSGTHVLSKYIYSRYGVGYAERGLGPGPNGECYISFMYGWAKYCLSAFGPDGKPMPGQYMKGKVESNKELDSAVIGPVPAANGGLRIDLDGNIYLGVLYWPPNVTPPYGYNPKNRAWSFVVGSVIKFPASGGEIALSGSSAKSVKGELAVYPGLAPFSRNGFGGNTCCVCRIPRFDLDPHGRLMLVNAVTDEVRIVDNAGNEILRFGRYGNFDSLFVNPNTEKGRAGKPTVATPQIPLAWPTCAQFSENAVYVCDTYTRRVVRLKKTWETEKTVRVK